MTSIVVIAPWGEMSEETGTLFNEQLRATLVKRTFPKILDAYRASKVAALNSTEDCPGTEHSHFAVNNIASSFTLGRNELAAPAAGAIIDIHGSALGHVQGRSAGLTPSTNVHVDDIARMYVLALNPKIPRSNVFIGLSENSDTQWDNSFDTVKRYFLGAVKNGPFPPSGRNGTKKLRFDNNFTKKTLGMEILSCEEQLRSVTGHHLELLVWRLGGMSN